MPGAISPGDLVQVAGEVYSFNSMIGEGKQHLIAVPIIGLVIDVIEPYLIQQGYLVRTPRGRVATPRCYLHLGLEVPESIVHASGKRRQQNLPSIGD